MANLLSSDYDYKTSNYFLNRHGGDAVEHCVGNSCDNLRALDIIPAPHIEIPELPHSTVMTSGPTKPARSEPDDVHSPTAVVPPPHLDNSVHTDSADGVDFSKTEYYEVLRRRSLEGRAPIHFVDSGEHPLEENIASEEFDVALY